MAEHTHAHLQIEAGPEVPQQESGGVFAQILANIVEFGATAKDIYGRKRSKRAPASPKYRDPVTGATWSGRGTPPAWIANAMNRDRYLIRGSLAK